MPPSFHPSALVARAVGFASTDNIQCPRPKPDEVGAPLFGEGSIDLHQLMIYVSAPCLLVTLLSCWYLSWTHLHRYTSPQEQRQILRIANLPGAYCLFNFLALTFTLDYMYIEPIAGVYEAFTTAALFFLILEWVAPDGTDREKYFDSMPAPNKKGKPQSGGSLVWFQNTWASALQYPVMKTIFILIQVITQYFGDYCESSFSFKHAHLYLTVLDYIFIGGALGAVIKFARRVKNEIAPVHKGRAKIWSFIGILIFQMIQDLIFHLLNGKLFSPSKTATYNDINFGISSFMTCIEAVIFSLIFQWSFSSAEYKEGEKINRYGTGPAERTRTMKAILDALNVSDIVSGSVVAFKLLFARLLSRYGGNVQSRYGGSKLHRGQDDQMHLEPVSDRANIRGYAQAPQEEYDTEYRNNYNPPPFPPTARAPSPGLRPGQNDYSQGYTGEHEESQPLTQARSMV